MSEQVLLSNLSIDGQKTVIDHTTNGGHKKRRYGGGRGLIGSLVLFLFFWFIVFVILVAWAPKWLRRKDGAGSRDDSGSKRSRKCLDYGKAFLWALVVSIIAILLFWLLSGVTAGFVNAVMRKC